MFSNPRELGKSITPSIPGPHEIADRGGLWLFSQGQILVQSDSINHSLSAQPLNCTYYQEHKKKSVLPWHASGTEYVLVVSLFGGTYVISNIPKADKAIPNTATLISKSVLLTLCTRSFPENPDACTHEARRRESANAVTSHRLAKFATRHRNVGKCAVSRSNLSSQRWTPCIRAAADTETRYL